MTRVSTFTELNEAALRDGCSKLLTFWYILRYIAQDRSCISYDEAETRYCAITGKSTETFRQNVNEAAASWWIGYDRAARIIHLRGLSRIARMLGVDEKKVERVLIPLSDLVGGIARRRAALYATTHVHQRLLAPPKENRPKSRAYIQYQTGCSKNTQLRYEAKVGVYKKHQHRINQDEARDKPSPISQETYFANPGLVGWVQYDGKWYWNWQIPNLYNAPYESAGRARLSGRHEPRLAKGNDPNCWRMYYTDPKKAARAIERGLPIILSLAERGGDLWIRE